MGAFPRLEPRAVEGNKVLRSDFQKSHQVLAAELFQASGRLVLLVRCLLDYTALALY